MNLQVGTRLATGPHSHYLVGEPAAWCGRIRWRHARKLFRNYRHADRSLFEADAEESLPVLIREPSPSRGSLEFELEFVLNLPEASWLLEPIDLIEDAGVARLVVADPLAVPLMESPITTRTAMLDQFVAMMRELSDHRLFIRSFHPEDFAVASGDRAIFFGTDLVERVSKTDFEPALKRTGLAWNEFRRITSG